MTFNLKRKYIVGLANWLQTLSLSGQESRNRTKFVEQLTEEAKENELTRLEFLKKYALLDEEGNLRLIDGPDGNKKYDVPDDKFPLLQKDVIDFLEQDLVMGGPGLKTRLEMVRDIVLNTQTKIDGSIATDYDAWCEAFEKMTE